MYKSIMAKETRQNEPKKQYRLLVSTRECKLN